MKRFLALVLLSATILGSSFLLSSCSSKTYNGIFYYEIKRNNTVCIESLTPKGKELQSLTIPDKIDGYPVCQVGFHPPLLSTSFYSDNLQRIYLPNTVIKFYISIDGKIISMNSNINTDSTFCNPYFSQITSIESNHAEVEPNKYANVVYLYNYESAPNGGIYSLDDYDNEPILYPPENVPVRDGYTFAGWYKEKECITPWDFETDIVPPKQYAEYEDIRYNGEPYTATKQILTVVQLFAKWTKIG